MSQSTLKITCGSERVLIRLEKLVKDALLEMAHDGTLTNVQALAALDAVKKTRMVLGAK